MRNQQCLIIYLLATVISMSISISILAVRIASTTANTDKSASESIEQLEAVKSPLFTVNDLESINDKLFENLYLVLPIGVFIYSSLKLVRFVHGIRDKTKPKKGSS